jgi:hypothetical protein
MDNPMAIPPIKASEAFAQSQGSPTPLAAPLDRRSRFRSPQILFSHRLTPAARRLVDFRLDVANYSSSFSSVTSTAAQNSASSLMAGR